MSALRVARKVQRLFTNQMGMKLTAIVFSIGLFALVRGAQDAQRTVLVEVAPLLPPDTSESVLVSEIPEAVRLTLQGSRSVLSTIQRDGIPPVHVDVRDTEKRYLYLNQSSFEMPPGVNIIQISPASIRLNYAKRVQKRVKILAETTGKSRRGLSVLPPVRVVPDTIIVRGPKGKVSDLKIAHTEPIDISSLDVGTHVQEIPLEPPADFVSYLDQSSVRVEIEIVPEIKEKRLNRLSVAVLGAQSAKLRPTRVTVVLQGDPEIIDSLDPEHIVPYVSLADLASTKRGMQPISVYVRGVPKGVNVARILPPDVLVALQKK
ncbi:MAG: hypothetical protein IPJ88_15855 [Myxococcales bacterium]|nr:MAG: hypothetical protein IPJ88_15855 [Myxococcales bacterium]